MNVLIDGGLNKNGTGIASYTQYLADALVKQGAAVSTEDFTPKGGKIRRRLSYLRYLNSRAYRKKLSRFDVVHYTNYAMPKKLPKGVVCAVTVHDLTAFAHPETLSRAYALYNRRMVKRALSRANIVFTVSKSIAAEIAARFPWAKAKILPVYPGFYTDAAKSPAAHYENEALQDLTPKKFFLAIGTVEHRKNLPELVKAYSAFVKENQGYALVLAGGYGKGADAVFSAVEAAPDEADIRLPGFVSNADRAKLLAEATALVFPSIYEGFGSPQTEAMAAGIPLILSDIPTNREVSGNLALFYPVGDHDLLAKALEQTALGAHSANREACANRLARFDWHHAASEIFNAYKSAKEDTAAF